MVINLLSCHQNCQKILKLHLLGDPLHQDNQLQGNQIQGSPHQDHRDKDRLHPDHLGGDHLHPGHHLQNQNLHQNHQTLRLIIKNKLQTNHPRMTPVPDIHLHFNIITVRNMSTSGDTSVIEEEIGVLEAKKSIRPMTETDHLSELSLLNYL